MNFIQIRSFDNYINANLQLSMLKEEGIDCYLKDEYTVTVDPLLSNAIGGMKLMVDELQIQKAIDIIETAEKDFLHSIPCPHCGKHSLELIVKTRQPSGFWQKITFLLINGQAEEVKKYYQCSSCFSKFDQINSN
jgi:DNA-directed RNA polymerase subunit RPC12/RpoP